MRGISGGLSRIAVTAAVVGGLLAGGLVPAAQAGHAVAGRAPDDGITEKLKAIPGMKLLAEKPSGDPAYRFFFLSYQQPADHGKPGKNLFEQRFTLLHKNVSRPMVLATSGYGLRETPRRAEPTQLLDGNQLMTEQRFFGTSRPAKANLKKQMTIWQAATDHHRLIKALKPVYSQKWVSTGVSKGGMTSTYHRRFYPKDVAGTVAYVAPNDVNNKADSAYDKFMKNVGTNPPCRKAVQEVQREALKRRKAMTDRIEEAAAKDGLTFKIAGNVTRAFEAALGYDGDFMFWQYLPQDENCPKVPDAKTVSDDDLYKFWDGVVGMTAYSDQGLEPYVTYYYQAGTQLGWPSLKSKHIRKLLKYPLESYQPRAFVPRDVPMRFQKNVMRDVDRWVKRKGSQLMFLYGGNDPWGAEPFELGRRTKDSFWYDVPLETHHGSLISRMPAAEKQKATSMILRWAGATPSQTAATPRHYVSPLDTRDEPTHPARRPPL